MTDSTHAVFLSYASQDAQAAQKICAALRAAGIEVWFDQSELRGGDAWDRSIRRQIKNCALFIPVISKSTHDRDEGYFRLEWKLAVDRSDLMSANRAFLLPVVIDGRRDDDEQVPDRFREVQWTRLPGGETPPAAAGIVRDGNQVAGTLVQDRLEQRIRAADRAEAAAQDGGAVADPRHCLRQTRHLLIDHPASPDASAWFAACAGRPAPGIAKGERQPYQLSSPSRGLAGLSQGFW